MPCLLFPPILIGHRLWNGDAADKSRRLMQRDIAGIDFMVPAEKYRPKPGATAATLTAGVLASLKNRLRAKRFHNKIKSGETYGESYIFQRSGFERR